MLFKGKRFSLDGIKRILLIQLGDIGDVVLTTPTIKALGERQIMLGASQILGIKSKSVNFSSL